MKNNARKGSVKGGILLLLILVAGGFAAKYYLLDRPAQEKRQQAQAQEQRKPQAPAVVLYTVEKADLAVPREYLGRVVPIQIVDLRPQISGTIDKVHFKEGSLVKEGDLLFTLDDREFKTSVALRKAELAKAEANYDRASKYKKRLQAADSRSVSASDMDMAESDVLQAKAEVQQAKAALQLAQINLSYTKIAAPISGRAGKALFTKGNYVTPAITEPLTTIVQIDPIRVTFPLPDREYLNQLEAFRNPESAVYDTTLTLANGKAYDKKGERDFENNVMDKGTATITISLRFENSQGALVPESMVRVQARPAKSEIVPVIPQEAVLADRAGDFVYVVDGENKANQTRIVLGESIGKMCEVTSGLKGGEKIVLLGLQALRPGMVVAPLPEEKNTTKSPAELAQVSGYDLTLISSDDTGNTGKDE